MKNNGQVLNDSELMLKYQMYLFNCHCQGDIWFEDFRPFTFDEWIGHGSRLAIDDGITTNEYFELQSLGLSKLSVRKYFYELADKGFLKITNKVQRSNVYDLSDSDFVSIDDDLKHINPKVYENIAYELGSEIADLVKCDVYVENLDVMNFDSEVDKPRWL